MAKKNVGLDRLPLRRKTGNANTRLGPLDWIILAILLLFTLAIIYLVCTPADTRKLMDSLDVKNPDTLLKVLGRKFAQKEPHRAHLKIMTSLDRRGIPYERK